MPETRLTCISPEAAAAVVAEATRPGDTAHTVRQDGPYVVIGYADPRWPLDVASWAAENGHAHDDDAARVIAGLGRQPADRPAEQHPTAPGHITLSRDQLAALLAHHADVLAARWDAYAPDPAAYALRIHAGELTAEEETPAVAELLDSMMSFRAPDAARQASGQQPDNPRPGRCPVMIEGVGRCEKDANHRAGVWPDDPHTSEPTPAGGLSDNQPANDLTPAERQFLTLALDLAADQMANRGDEFDDEDDAALARLRRMAVEEDETR